MPGIWARCHRTAMAVIFLFASWAVAGAASAARLVDVRVGVHPGFTRVVFETDARAAYELQPKDDELLVQLQASGAAEAITSRSAQLMWVRVQPAGAATEVRIQVKGTVEVRQMVLKAPDRIVLDLYPSTAASAPAPTAAPESTPAPLTPPPADPVPAPTPEPDLAEAPVPAAEPPDLDPAEDEPVYPEEVVVEEEVDADGRVDELAVEETAPELPGGEAGETGDDLASAEPSVPEPAPVERPRVELPVAEPEPDGGLIGMLLSPVGLGGLAILFLAVFLLLRRRGQDDDETLSEGIDAFAGDEPDPSAEAQAEAEAMAVAEPGAEEAAEAAVVVPEAEDAGLPEAREAEDSLFDVGEDEVAAAPAPSPEEGGGAPTVVAGAAAASIASDGPPAEWVEEYGEEMARIIQELESRVSHLETRLEEVLDSKERLERQVSAQTEELRVQRAAIARTQRVLRTVSRPEDEASEPAPKV